LAARLDCKYRKIRYRAGDCGATGKELEGAHGPFAETVQGKGIARWGKRCPRGSGQAGQKALVPDSHTAGQHGKITKSITIYWVFYMNGGGSKAQDLGAQPGRAESSRNGLKEHARTLRDQRVRHPKPFPCSISGPIRRLLLRSRRAGNKLATWLPCSGYLPWLF
jgi:hypothetical protein